MKNKRKSIEVNPVLVNKFKKVQQESAKKKKKINKDSINSLALGKKLLATSGNDLRKKLKDQSESKRKNIILSTRSVVNILEKYIHWAILGNSKDDWQKSALFFYNVDTGIYDKNSLAIDELINTVEPQITEKNIKEVKAKLRIESERLILTDNPKLYVLGNGIFDSSTKQLLNYSPKYVFTSKINVNYNPNAKEPKFENWSFSNWINEDIAQGQQDKIKLIWQTFKAVINSNYSYHSAIFLLDANKGSAGKGTFEQLLENIAGVGNYASIKLNEFERDAILATIVNKPLVIGDDNDPNKPIDSSERFKSASTGDSIIINDKFEKAYSYKPTCLIVQSLNALPRFKDHTDATYRRIRVIKFNKHYVENANNRKIKDEYIYNKELLEWIVKKAINEKIDGVMIHTKESDEILNENKLDSDPVLQFINDAIVPTEGEYRFQDTTYQAFKTWYINTGHNKFIIETFRGFNKRMRDYGFISDRKYRNENDKSRRKLGVWLNIKLNTDTANLTHMDVMDAKGHKNN